MQFITVIVHTVFWRLYFEGPTLGGYGFWGGKDPADICQELTGVSAAHWMQNMDTCEDKLGVNFKAFYIGVMTVLMAILVWKIVSMFLWHVFFVRPMMKALIARVSPRRLLNLIDSKAKQDHDELQ